MDWISKRKISIIPVTFSLDYFNPSIYTDGQNKMMLQKGFNPKMSLYRLNDQANIAKQISEWTKKLGPDFTKLPNNFWFCIKESKCGNCPTGCKDKISKFIYTGGIRAPKNVQLGKGEKYKNI